MKITKQELIEMEACRGGLFRFVSQTGDTVEPVDVSTLVGGLNTYGDLLWLAGKKLPKERIVRFACDCALLNIELIKPHTDKYDEIVEFLRNPVDDVDVRIAVRTAIHVTTCCDDYADCAVEAAEAACTDTIHAAASAAYNASHVIGDSKEKVDELLKELFA